MLQKRNIALLTIGMLKHHKKGIPNNCFRRGYFVYFAFLLFYSNLFAQGELKHPNLRFYLSEDKSSYAGMVMVNQVWTRYIWNNPDNEGNQQPGELDFALRRSRVILYTYLMDKVFVYTQVGYDGLNYRSGNPALSLYNAQTEYILAKNKLHLGFGLSTWNGLSRYNNAKLLDFLCVDNPGFVYPVGGSFDRFGRQLGVYMKGTLDRLHYRVSAAKPFETGFDQNTESTTVERKNNNLAFKGYFNWQFFDVEGQLFPYMTMNNLGRAKLLHVGAGFYYHPDAMWESMAGSSQPKDIFLYSADVFLDMPLGNKGAITSYLGYYNYDFGKNYIKSSGSVNVGRLGASQTLPQGAGNAQWETGTGTIIRGEIGYLLPEKIIRSGLQPFAAFTWKDFEALDEAGLQYDVGVNVLISDHNIKWTLQYSNRPVYKNVNNLSKIAEYKGQVVFQTQIYF
jgi:hypothetical protein